MSQAIINDLANHKKSKNIESLILLLKVNDLGIKCAVLGTLANLSRFNALSYLFGHNLSEILEDLLKTEKDSAILARTLSIYCHIPCLFNHSLISYLNSIDDPKLHRYVEFLKSLYL